MTETARFALPLLYAGQAQKEIGHNEAITRIDQLLHPAVKGVATVPPATPQPGDAWIVGAGASGDWAGRSDQLACWTEGGWRFVAPRAGMVVWAEAATLPMRYIGASWQTGRVRAASIDVGGVQVVGPQAPAIPAPTGGTTVDAEARTAVAAILTALRAHGLIAGS